MAAWLDTQRAAPMAVWSVSLTVDQRADLTVGSKADQMADLTAAY